MTMNAARCLKLPALFLLLTLILGCAPQPEGKIRVLFDTDTNNELDDQHALAYLLQNDDIFEVEAVTVNATHSGGGIEEQYAEAKRVMRLVGKLGVCPLLKGADRSLGEFVAAVRRVGDSEALEVTASSAALCATGLAREKL